ncbi:MAG TPA: cytochrome C biogenesis protein [Firmicutes bacterium]|nr:cytochrome C biogenesis protein [Bacillota bacterium]
MIAIVLKILLAAWMVMVTVAAFIYAPPALGLGDLARIIFFHVPLAWVSVLAYLVSMVHSIRYLRNGLMIEDHKAALNAEIGLIFTVLATVTGSIFARYTWGMFWNWDPRESSIFILLLIYCAYFVLRSAVEDETRRARMASVFSIIAFISVPFLVFIIPRVYATLHPDPIISVEAGFQMDAKMFRVFIASLLGFTGLYAWLANIASRLSALIGGMEGEKDV